MKNSENTRSGFLGKIAGLMPYAVTPALLALFIISLILFAYAVVQKSSVQEALVASLTRHTGYQIRMGHIDLSLWRGLGVKVHMLEATGPHGLKRIKASRVRVSFDPLELLHGRIVPLSLVLVRPTIYVSLPKTKTPSPLPDPKDLPPFWIPGLESVRVEQGDVLFVNRPWELEDLTLEARVDENDALPLGLEAEGRMILRREAIPFSIQAKSTPMDESAGVRPFKLVLKARQIPAAALSWPREIAFEKGALEVVLTIEKKSSRNITGRGDITGADLRFDIGQNGRYKKFALPFAALTFSGGMTGNRVDIREMQFNTGELSADLQLQVDLEEGLSPHLKFSARTGFLPIGSFQDYFPSPLLPQWVETELFPLLSEGEARLATLSLEGTSEELSGTWGPEQRDNFSISVACRNFKVSGAGIPYPYEDVSADILYAQGNLTVGNLEARFKDSLINEGRLEVKSVMDQSPVWDLFMDGDFNLQTLKEQKSIKFIPLDVLQKLERVGEVSGRLSCLASFRYEPQWTYPRTSNGRFVLRECLVRQPELRLPLSLTHAEILVRDEDDNSFRTSGAWGLTRFEAEGTFGTGERVFPLRSAEVSASVDMNEAVPLFFKGFELPLAFERPVNTRFSLQREKDHWGCKGRVDLAGVTLRNERVSMRPPGREDHITFDIRMGPGEHVALREVVCRFRGSSLKLSGGYDLERKDLFTVELEAPRLDLEDIGIMFREHGHPSSGVVQGSLKIISSRQDPLSTVVLGKVEGKGVTAHLDWLPAPITKGSFTLDFSGKTFSIEECKMQLGDSSLEVAGELTGWEGIGGRLKVFAEYMEVKDFISEEITGATGGRGIPRDLNIRAEVHGLKGRWRELDFGPLRAEVHLKDGSAELARSRIRLDHGVLTSSGHINPDPLPQIYLSNHIRLTDQPLKTLLEDVGVEEPGLDGSLHMEAYLTMRGKRLGDLLPSMSGNANIEIKEGYIRRSGLFTSVLETLSLKNIFKTRPIEVPEGAFYFDEISGYAAIENGVLKTENAAMKSPVYNAVAAGKLDLVKEMFDFTMGVRPLESWDKIVSNIPIIGYAIGGKDKSFLTYYFEVKGPMLDPDVRHVPFKHLAGGVAGALKRLFLSPVRFYGTITRIPQESDSSGEDEEKDP